ncbi:hypothetical protein K0M31_013480 [Melipona bicolor]|uniref:Uncharacterized protein n=1 Tax=Melipona bicolor TaxID=60889 RepID=A0AA40FIQ7_9HYME|nr:hypothetical protein K0M31_013480 [Melipona bicolor]
MRRERSDRVNCRAARRESQKFLKRLTPGRCIYEIFAGVISGLGTYGGTRVHGKPEKGEEPTPLPSGTPILAVVLAAASKPVRRGI